MATIEAGIVVLLSHCKAEASMRFLLDLELPCSRVSPVECLPISQLPTSLSQDNSNTEALSGLPSQRKDCDSEINHQCPPNRSAGQTPAFNRFSINFKRAHVVHHSEDYAAIRRGCSSLILAPDQAGSLRCSLLDCSHHTANARFFGLSLANSERSRGPRHLLNYPIGLCLT